MATAAILGAAGTALKAGLLNLAADKVQQGVGEVLHAVEHPIETGAKVSRHTAKAKGIAGGIWDWGRTRFNQLKMNFINKKTQLLTRAKGAYDKKVELDDEIAEFDRKWREEHPNPTKEELAAHEADMKAKNRARWKEINEAGKAAVEKKNEEVRQASEKLESERQERQEERNEAMFHEEVDNHASKWLGIDPEKNAGAQLANQYAGGTSISKVVTQISQMAKLPKEQQDWRKIDFNSLTGACSEVIGKLSEKSQGSTWTPEVSAAINALTKLGSLNPWVCAGMNAAALIATCAPVRSALKTVAGLAGRAAKWAWNLVRGGSDKIADKKYTDLALQHDEGVVPIHPSRVEVIRERLLPPSNISDEAHSRPNIGIPYERKEDYMARMLGGAQPEAPAAQNQLTYSGPRNNTPQYQKMANALMFAPSRPGIQFASMPAIGYEPQPSEPRIEEPSDEPRKKRKKKGIKKKVRRLKELRRVKLQRARVEELPDEP